MPTPPRQTAILLIEDSDDDAFFFGWALKRADAAALVAHVADGAAALERLAAVHRGERSRPDIVFLDLKLPTYSGFEILSWIREHPCRPALHVVVLSGSEHVGDVSRAGGLGASGYEVKPISPERLRRRLDAVADTTSSAS